MAPKSVTFRRHDHLVSVLFGDLLSHSYNITFSMFLHLVDIRLRWIGSAPVYGVVSGEGVTPSLQRLQQRERLSGAVLELLQR